MQVADAVFLGDEGPYSVAPLAVAQSDARSALGRLQRDASSFIVVIWTALGIACMVLLTAVFLILSVRRLDAARLG